jgi:hypothetical protein
MLGEKSSAFRRVLEEPLPLICEEAATRLLYRCPLDGDVDDAAPLLLVGFPQARASSSVFFSDSKDVRMALCSAAFSSGSGPSPL